MKLDVKKMQLIMARKELGIRELAKKAGVSAASVSKYARGLVEPSIRSLGKVANALDVDVTEIIEDTTKKE